MPTLGEIIKDCKCQKCPTGVPAVGGSSCQDNCPSGQEKNDKGGCCPTGQKPKAKGDGCEPKQPNNDDKDKDKGKCPDGKMLDPKEGWDPKTTQPKCQIDDEKTCAKPKVPGTRPDGKENDASYKVECGEPEKDENKRPKCDPKTQYVHTNVQSTGQAVQSCKQTRKFYDRKREKPTSKDLKTRVRELWNKLKDRYSRENKDREANLKKLKEIEEKRAKEDKERTDKLNDKKDKQKRRMSECSTSRSILIGAVVKEATGKRDGEHPYDWTTDYFDEEFVSSDDRLKDWAAEVDVEKISEKVDTDAFLKKWDQIIDDQKRPHASCNFVGRSLETRCSQKRSLGAFEGWNDDIDLDTRSNATSADESDIEPIVSLEASSLVERNTGLVISRDASSGSIQDLEKRNPFAALFGFLASFGSRMGVSIVARATASVAARSPRLANLIKNPERLFQIAPKGKGAKGGQNAMKSAKESIMKEKDKWVKCLKDGLPL
ncbi:hypothetical protein CC86DRAFT_395146 [Ophiobolus disseminans]|uniref:Uncharacterized protein n=1 Tax=Ophiobolus disseminans TaxID=1469910 RepID=A0A6A6ZUC9_9PLEO|nr:hypothetical protein CC86DRAFT_395146 [Ophiobolus disseminans]